MSEEQKDTLQNETLNQEEIKSSDEHEENKVEQSEENVEIKNSEEELETLKAQCEGLKEQLLREKAENENLRKRQEREIENVRKFATEGLLKSLFPVLDSLVLGLESARQNIDKPDAIQQFIDGSEMTLKLLRDSLGKYGVEEINPQGEKFDPEKHEALAMQANPEMEHNSIMHVAQRGYLLNGRTVRAAQVVVVKND